MRRRTWPLAVAVVVLAVGGAGAFLSFGSVRNARTFSQPGDDQASTSRCTAGSPTLRGQAALLLIDYPWERLGYRFAFEPGRKGFLAITNTGTKVITLYVRRCQGVDELAHTLAHEVGHAIDDRYFTGADRAQIAAYRGYAGVAWYPSCNACSDYSSGAGDWAEVAAQLIGPPGRFRSRLNGPPGAGAQRDAMAAYIERDRAGG